MVNWNINTVILRLDQVLCFIKENDIDVMCLQEIRTPDKYFPTEVYKRIEFQHHYFRGEKSYNGVAIISNLEL